MIELERGPAACRSAPRPQNADTGREAEPALPSIIAQGAPATQIQEAVRARARQVECTINGIGRRPCPVLARLRANSRPRGRSSSQQGNAATARLAGTAASTNPPAAPTHRHSSRARARPTSGSKGRDRPILAGAAGSGSRGAALAALVGDADAQQNEGLAAVGQIRRLQPRLEVPAARVRGQEQPGRHHRCSPSAVCFSCGTSSAMPRPSINQSSKLPSPSARCCTSTNTRVSLPASIRIEVVASPSRMKEDIRRPIGNRDQEGQGGDGAAAGVQRLDPHLLGAVPRAPQASQLAAGSPAAVVTQRPRTFPSPVDWLAATSTPPQRAGRGSRSLSGQRGRTEKSPSERSPARRRSEPVKAIMAALSVQ